MWQKTISLEIVAAVDARYKMEGCQCQAQRAFSAAVRHQVVHTILGLNNIVQRQRVCAVLCTALDVAALSSWKTRTCTSHRRICIPGSCYFDETLAALKYTIPHFVMSCLCQWRTRGCACDFGGIAHVVCTSSPFFCGLVRAAFPAATPLRIL